MQAGEWRCGESSMWRRHKRGTSHTKTILYAVHINPCRYSGFNSEVIHRKTSRFVNVGYSDIQSGSNPDQSRSFLFGIITLSPSQCGQKKITKITKPYARRDTIRSQDIRQESIYYSALRARHASTARPTLEKMLAT